MEYVKDEDREYDLWWAVASEFSGIRSVSDVRKAGSARGLFFAKEEELKTRYGFGQKAAEHIIYSRKNWNYEKKMRELDEKRIRFIPYYDAKYPKRLLQTKGFPFALFVMGELPEENLPAVALIGARECSEYGRSVAAYFGRELALAGVNVISGMAIGIDGIGQQEALSAGGKSYAVLGCGPDLCYPYANRKLYERLKEKGGLLSEYGPGVKAVSWHFPARNRILAGISDLVIVVEAKEKSGTLITVDMALDAGREIMVIPGRITDPMSMGCNRLWKAGANVATCVEDVLMLLKDSGYSFEKNADSGSDGETFKNKIHLESEEELVYSCFDLYAKNAEEALKTTGISYQDRLRILTELEWKGLLREVGCGYYVQTPSL